MSANGEELPSLLLSSTANTDSSLTNLVFRSYIGNNTWMGNDGRDDDAKRAYEGVLNIEQKFGTAQISGSKVANFQNRVRRRLREPPFNVTIHDNSKVWN